MEEIKHGKENYTGVESSTPIEVIHDMAPPSIVSKVHKSPRRVDQNWKEEK